MKIGSPLSIALLSGLSVAAWTSFASAQPAGYAAARAKCRAQVHSQYPTAIDSEGARSSRAKAFRACLFGLGYRP